MKTPENHEPLRRFVAGEMKDEEISGFLKEHVSMERPVPNADFFNSQIVDRIAGEQRTKEIHGRQRTGSGWLHWLLRPWALASAAALIALAAFVWQQTAPTQKTEVVHTYTPDPSIHATSTSNSSADATVLTLDGLAGLPDDHEVSVLRVHHSSRDPEIAATTLYDAGGNVLLVLDSDTAAL